MRTSDEALTAPGETMCWASEGGRVAARCWSPDDALEAPPWSTDAGLVVVSGQLRSTGRSWTSPSRWAVEVAEGRRARPYGHPLDGFQGDGTAVVVDDRGYGVLAADPLGLASVYASQVGPVHVFGSHPSEVAAARARLGVPRWPDRLAAACLVLVGHLVGERTSLEGIHRLPVGSRVLLQGPREPRLVCANPWYACDEHHGLDQDSLCDVVEETIAGHLVSALGAAPDEPVLDLTGGKDSRLVLAVALRRGLAERFRLTTVGGPAVPDVAFARAIADQLALEHHHGVPRRENRRPFAEEVATFVRSTEGMHSAWMMATVQPRTDEVRVSATSGEVLRTVPLEDLWFDDHGERKVAGPDTVSTWLNERLSRGGAGGLLAEARAGVADIVEQEIGRLGTGGVADEDLLHAFFIGHHGLKLGGHRVELEPELRIRALTDLTATRAVAAMGPAGRWAEVAHRTLIRRASPLLDALPVMSGRWNETLPTLAPAPVDPAPRTSGGPLPTDAPGYSFLGLAQAKADDGREAFLRDALAGAANPVWDIADRSVVSGWLDDLDSLSMKNRQQLHALAGTALWLSQTT